MHAGIIGMTGSGKTRLGKVFCRGARQRRTLTLVLDPMLDDRWECDLKTDDIARFEYECWRRKGAVLFIDEVGGFGKFSPLIEKLMCKGRHLGHAIFIMTQRLTQVSPLVRDQLGEIYLFASGDSAHKIIAEEFRQPAMLQAPRLNPGEFFKVSRFSESSKYSIDFRTGKVYKSTHPNMTPMEARPPKRGVKALEASCTDSSTKTASSNSPPISISKKSCGTAMK